MANKQTVQDVDDRMDVLIKRLVRTANEINELRIKRRKMVTGRIKVPAPAGIKVHIAALSPEFSDDLPEDLKLRPVSPGSCGPC